MKKFPNRPRPYQIWMTVLVLSCFTAGMAMATDPAVGEFYDVTTYEDQDTSTSFSIYDPDPYFYFSSVTSSNQTLLPDANIVNGGYYFGRWAWILKPVANRSGTTTLSITVSEGSFSTTRTCLVTVLPVNDPPRFTKGANVVIASGITAKQTVTAWAKSITDNDPEVQTLTFETSIYSGDNGIFTVTPSITPTGTLTYTPSGVIGTATVAVKLRDNGGAEDGGIDVSPIQLFTIKVTAGAQVTLEHPPGTALVSGGGQVKAWGVSNYGETNVPANLIGVTAISAGPNYTLAVRGNGTVTGWGYNSQGQLDIPPGLKDVVSVSAGYSNPVAVKRDGTVAHWGTRTDIALDPPASLTNVKAVAAGSFHTAALKYDGSVVAWGSNAIGQTTIPAGLAGVAAITAGHEHTIAMRTNGTFIGWGSNLAGEARVPTGYTDIIAIASGSRGNMALRSNSTILRWGEFQGDATMPSGLTNLKDLATGEWSRAALRNDGTMVAWGTATTDEVLLPASLTNVILISSTGSHGVAVVGSTVNFDPQPMATRSSAKTFPLKSNGTAALNLQNINITGEHASDFVMSTDGFPTSLPVGGQTNLEITFSPHGLGSRAAMLRILSNDAEDSTFEVALTGIGLVGNSPPQITSNGGGDSASLSIAEGRTIVTTLQANDPEVPATQTLSFTKSGEDAGLFTLSSAGVIAFTTPPDFELPSDANEDGVYHVILTVTDNDVQNPLADSQELAVTVTNANEMPGFVKGPDQTVFLGTTTPQTVSPWATSITDGEATVVQNLEFSITGNSNPGLFAVPPALGSDGTLTFTPTGAPGTANISVVLTDDTSLGGNPLSTPEQIFSITTSTSLPNKPPTFADYVWKVRSGTSTRLSFSKLLKYAADVDGGVVTVSSVAAVSSSGGSIAADGTGLTYTPLQVFTGLDAIAITITDGQGGSTQGTVYVIVGDSALPASKNQPLITRQADGGIALLFLAIPRQAYVLQRSPDLVNWSMLYSASASSDGSFTFTDLHPLEGTGFYRLAIP